MGGESWRQAHTGRTFLQKLWDGEQKLKKKTKKGSSKWTFAFLLLVIHVKIRLISSNFFTFPVHFVAQFALFLIISFVFILIKRSFILIHGLFRNHRLFFIDTASLIRKHFNIVIVWIGSSSFSVYILLLKTLASPLFSQTFKSCFRIPPPSPFCICNFHSLTMHLYRTNNYSEKRILQLHALNMYYVL